MGPVVEPTADLGAAIAANMESWVPLFAGLPGARLERVHGVARWTSDLPLPMFNGILGWPLGPDDDVLDDIARPFRDRAIPALWITPPGADANEALRARGFEPDAVPGMAIDLRALPPLEIPPGAEVHVVDDDPAALDQALHISLVTGGFPSDSVGAFRAALDSYPERDRLRTFLATVDGVAVAAGGLWCGAGVAGLYNVGTLAGYRRRGLGRLVSIATMRAGFEAGYLVGVLQASEMGSSMYERIGFTRHGDFTFAVRMPPEEDR
jgi:GNAT superfamily N-acetyltransferase